MARDIFGDVEKVRVHNTEKNVRRRRSEGRAEKSRRR